MNVIQKTLHRIDDFQQTKKPLAFPFAVVKKFGDDRAGNLAALIAYYGFFSLFPLMLVMVAVLGFVLRGNPDLQAKVINSALSQFPVVGDQLKGNIKALTGSGAGVVLGLGTLGAVWAGLGVTNAAQNAFNDVWGVPLKERPNFLESRVRGLIMLVVLGVMSLAATFLSGLGTVGGAKFIWLGAIALIGSLGLNLLLYLVAFRVLTTRDLSWGDVFAGAVVGAVLWTALQFVGGFYVGHTVKNASSLYGTFGFVIGLLTWIYLGAQLTLYAAEVNVVRKDGLWPRSLVQPPFTEADKRTMERSAKVEERKPEESVDVFFDAPTKEVGAGPDDGSPATEALRSPIGPPSVSEGADGSRDDASNGHGRAKSGAVKMGLAGVAVGVLTAMGLRRRRRPHD